MAQEDPGLQELVNDFVTESREHLAHVESDLLSLESESDDGGDRVNRVFRAVHSVKGVAGFLGFDHINKLSHALESVLDLVRKDRLETSAELVDALLAATDSLRGLVEHVQESNQMPIDDQLQRLQGFLDANAAAAAHAPAAATEVAADEWLFELDLVLPRIALAKGCSVAEIVDAVGKLGRVTAGGSVLASKTDADTSRAPVTIALASKLPLAEVREQLFLDADEVRELRAPRNAPAVARAPVAASPTTPTVAAPAVLSMPASTPAAVAPMPAHEPVDAHAAAAALHEPTAPVEPAQHAAPRPAGPGGSDKAKADGAGGKRAEGSSDQPDSIRVSVHLLDKLMNLSGELVLGRNQLIQAQGSGNEKGIAVAAARLNLVVSEMQEAIMQTRMQPIGTLFQRFPRIVRDLSGKLGKRCRLEIEGKDVDLDRSILEALSDPLTHIVRNSVDHGMELPEQRRQAGKGQEGVVRMTAMQQGGNVLIEISDDGRGIDPVRLKKKAVEKGVITVSQAQMMSDREAVNLIFAPGFSTAEKVTDVSGRGVGMDVVRSNIEKLGGHVDVQSFVGKGTTMAITIPLTLAILPAMVISCGPRRYVLAQANVAELVRVREGEGSARIVALDGREVLRLRGSVLPLLRLRAVLGEPPSEQKESTIVVIETGNTRYGLTVDAPPDAEEIVVKPLGRHLKKRMEYAGATILGDGRVAMILDAAGVAEAANLAAVDRGDKAAAEAAAKEASDTAELVLFRNHPTETFAVPLGLVDRIQRVEATAIQEVGGRTVFADGERALPIVRLEGVLKAQPGQSSNRVSVLVLRIDKHQFGVVAPSVEDIRSLQVHIDDKTLAEEGVLGSFQMQERTVRLLDPTAVARKALPQLFTQPVVPAKAAAAAPRGPVRVLFAEDTKFFREHVARTLRGAGFDVTAVADGELAWQELQKPGVAFDVIVTDVQMPNCDGFELTRRIRRQESLAKLPVVALTSLSSTEHESEGIAAGVSTYLVKLDDAALIAAIRQQAGVTA
jgi:two-component system chemotaxis sensor kinase CheA